MVAGSRRWCPSRPWRDAQGAIIGYLLTGTDNTARQQVEDEKKKLNQRLRDQQFYTRSLIESNIDAIMTTDPSGIIPELPRHPNRACAFAFRSKLLVSGG